MLQKTEQRRILDETQKFFAKEQNSSNPQPTLPPDPGKEGENQVVQAAVVGKETSSDSNTSCNKNDESKGGEEFRPTRILRRGETLDAFPVTIKREIKSEPKTDPSPFTAQIGDGERAELISRLLESKAASVTDDLLEEEMQKQQEDNYSEASVLYHQRRNADAPSEVESLEYVYDQQGQRLKRVPPLVEKGLILWDRIQAIDRSRGLAILFEIFTLVGLMIGIICENFMRGIVLVVLALLAGFGLHIILDQWSSFVLRRRRKRLRKLSIWEMLICYFWRIDELWENDVSTHANPRLPETAESVRRNLHIGRHRSVSLLKGVNVASNKRRFLVEFSPDQVSGKRYFINAKIAGVPTRCLIDTGAEVSVCSAAYLREMEARLGRRFVRLSHDQKIIGVTGESPPSVSSITSLDVQISQGGSDLLLNNVTFFSIESSGYTVILGMNVLETLRTEVKVRGPQTYLTFKRVPEFPELPVCFDSNDAVALETMGATLLPPKQWVELKLKVPFCEKRETNWGKSSLLVSQNNEYKDAYPMQFGEVTELKRGEASVWALSETDQEMFLPAGTDLFHVSQLSKHMIEDVSPALNCMFFPHAANYQELDKCPCELREESTVAYITNWLGVSGTGPTVYSRFQTDPYLKPGFYNEKDGDDKVWFFVPHRHKQFVPLQGTKLFDWMARTSFRKNTLTVIIPDPAALDQTLFDIIVEMRKTLNVNIRSINPATLCQGCEKSAIWQLSAIPITRKVGKLNIIMPSMSNLLFDENVDSHLWREEATRVHSFEKMDVKVDVFLRRAAEATALIHLPKPFGLKSHCIRNVLLTIMADLKRSFPHAAISVLSNIPVGVTGCIEEGLAKALADMKWVESFERELPPASFSKKEGKTVACQLQRGDCACAFCDTECSGKKIPLRVLHEDSWPTFSQTEIEENLDQLEAADASSRQMVKVLRLLNAGTDKGVASTEPDGLQPQFKSELDNGAIRDRIDVPITRSEIEGSVATKSSPEDLTPSEAEELEDALGVPNFKYTKPGPYSDAPFPRTIHSPLNIQEVFEVMRHHLEKLPLRKLASPMLILLFVFRFLFRLGPQDKGMVTNFKLRIRAKKPYALIQNPRCVPGFDIKPHLLPALRQIIEKNIQGGSWQRGQYTCFVSQCFAVIRNSSLRLVGKLSEREEITEDDIRLIVDLRALNSATRPLYHAGCINALTCPEISNFLGDSKLISNIDIKGAFDSVPLESRSKPLCGLKLTKTEGVLRSNVCLQGFRDAPLAWKESLARAMDERSKRAALVFYDDILLHSKNVEGAVIKGAEGQDADTQRVGNEGNCSKCNLVSCTGLHDVVLEQKIDYVELEEQGYKFNAIKDRKFLREIIEKYDPEGYLPHDLLVSTYFTTPCEKGQTVDGIMDFEMPPLDIEERDDISKEEIQTHFRNIVFMFRSIQRHGSKLNAKKCEFLQKSVEFYGFRFEAGKSYIPAKRKQYFESLRGVNNISQLHSLLGAFLFISNSIPGLGHYTRPLYRVLSRSKKTELSPFHRRIINHLIDRVQEAPPLTYPGPNDRLYIITDASLLAVGAIVGFYDYAGKLVISGYYSYQLPSNLARGLSIAEKELYSASRFVMQHAALLQRRVPTVLYTDSRVVQRLLEADEIPPHSRMASAVYLLRSSPLHIKCHWRPGNGPDLFVSDALSRLQLPFLPGSLLRRRAERIIASGTYTEDVANICIPKELAGAELPMSELPLFMEMHKIGHFTRCKKHEDESPSVLIREHLGPEEIAAYDKGLSDNPDDLLEVGDIKDHGPVMTEADFDEKAAKVSMVFLDATLGAIASGAESESPSLMQNVSSSNSAELYVSAVDTGGPEPMTAEQKRVAMREACQRVPLSPVEVSRLQSEDDVLGDIIRRLKGEEKAPKRLQKRYRLTPTMLLQAKVGNEWKTVLPQEAAVNLLVAIHARYHMSIENMVQVAKKHFKITNLLNLAKIVRGACTPCNLSRTDSARLYVQGKNMRGDKAFSVVSIDHMHMPTVSHERRTYSYMLGVYCTFSRLSVYYPLTSLRASETVKAFENFVSHFGRPGLVVSDKGRTFLSGELQSLFTRLGINYHAQLAYVGQNHQIERENLVISKLLNIFMLAEKTNCWPKVLPRAMDAARAIERTYIVANSDGEIDEIKSSVHRFLYGSDPPCSFNDLVEKAFGDEVVPQEARKARNSIQDSVRRAHEIEKEEFQKMEQELLQSQRVLQVGDFVMLRALPRAKYGPQYERTVYRVTSVTGRKIGLVTVFGNRPNTFTVHIKHVKKITSQDAMFEKVEPYLLRNLDPFPLPTDDAMRPPLPRALRSTISETPRPRVTDLRGQLISDRAHVAPRRQTSPEAQNKAHRPMPSFLLSDDDEVDVGNISSLEQSQVGTGNEETLTQARTETEPSAHSSEVSTSSDEGTPLYAYLRDVARRSLRSFSRSSASSSSAFHGWRDEDIPRVETPQGSRQDSTNSDSHPRVRHRRDRRRPTRLDDFLLY